MGAVGCVRGRRRPPPAPGLSPGPPGRLRPRRHAELTGSPGSSPGGGAAWAPGGGRRAGGARGPRAGRAGRRAARARADQPARICRSSGGVAAAGPGEAQAGGGGGARPAPAGPQEAEGGRGHGPRCRPGAFLRLLQRGAHGCEAGLRGTHTTSQAENDRVDNSCGCSVQLFLKGWLCPGF